MADTMQFDLVSPERRLASLQARAVRLPGAEGDMTAMPDHAPMITTLRPGLLAVETDAGEEEFLVTGGFAEISAESTTVLAEAALPRAEVTQEDIDRFVAEARAARDAAQPELTDAATKRAEDMSAAGELLGLRATG